MRGYALANGKQGSHVYSSAPVAPASSHRISKDEMNQPTFEYQTESKRKWLSRNYDRAAWFYETSARIYSGDQIAASKRYQLNHILPGEKTIFLGVGSGEDAFGAAEHGADVTCVDISSGMLARLERKLKRKNLTANLLCQNALELDASNQFDVCCTNYFLNMFKEPDMVKMMTHASKLVRPGGKLMIADVALGQGGAVQNALNAAYRKFAMVSFWALGLVELHRDYDYCSYFGQLGLEFEEVNYFRPYKIGPVGFQCIVATKL